MYKVELQWKEFNVDLDAVRAKLETDYPDNYKGNQAYSVLELYFENEPTEEQRAAIQSYWDGLTDQSLEATSYCSQADMKAALDSARSGLVSKTWDQMGELERKLVVGANVTKAELIAANLL